MATAEQTDGFAPYRETVIDDNSEPEGRDCRSGHNMGFVVPDAPAQYWEIADHLRGKGLELFKINDGVTAIAAIDKHNPEFVLMDVHMPFSDGIRAAKLVRTLSPKTTVILMSGLPEEVLRAERSDCGALTVLTKPIAREEHERSVFGVLRNVGVSC